MALPKNKGLRFIKVNGISYYWRIGVQDMENHELVVIIGLKTKPNKRFEFRFTHISWVDIIGTNEYEDLKDIKNELDIVKPRHIREAILEAETIEWSNSKNQTIIRLTNGKYHLSG